MYMLDKLLIGSHCPFFDIDLHICFQLIDGGNLEELIQKKDEELPWSLRISLALDVAKGLAYLHSRGMFHRDLTSKNILIRNSSGNKILPNAISRHGKKVINPSRHDQNNAFNI